MSLLEALREIRSQQQSNNEADKNVEECRRTLRESNISTALDELKRSEEFKDLIIEQEVIENGTKLITIAKWKSGSLGIMIGARKNRITVHGGRLKNNDRFFVEIQREQFIQGILESALADAIFNPIEFSQSSSGK